MKQKLLPEDYWNGAECRNYDPEIFYPDEYLTKESHRVINLAKAICNSCVIKEQCLDYAIESREEHGILGSMTPQERQKYARQNGRI